MWPEGRRRSAALSTVSAQCQESLSDWGLKLHQKRMKKLTLDTSQVYVVSFFLHHNPMM